MNEWMNEWMNELLKYYEDINLLLSSQIILNIARKMKFCRN